MKGLVAGGLAVLLGVQVVRVAAVRALAETAPSSAARVWGGHPDVQLTLGMTGIAAAAREGRPVPPDVLEAINAVARKAPLAEEPFLVRGIQAQLSGDGASAERAFLQAKWREGRSQPARYFLADHYLRRRDAARGLREIAVLSRLVPDGTSKLAPYVAQYAATPANRSQLRQLFRSEPMLEESSLAILAHDPRNTDLVLALSNPQRRTVRSGWFPLLLASLVKDGQYARARDIWADVSGVQVSPGTLLFDPQFRLEEPPPPFNWELTSSAVGIAERQPGGGLRVIYYGQEEGPLATQLLTLGPGSYRLTTRAAGVTGADSLGWTLVCATTNEPIASTPLDQAIARGWTVTVPASCPAQRLELSGRASDAARQVELTIQGVALSREQSP